MRLAISVDNRKKFLSLFLISTGIGGIVLSTIADLVGVGSVSGVGPKQVAVAIIGLSFAMAGITIWFDANLRLATEYLLIGIGACGAAYAADLIGFNNPASIWWKLFILLSLGVSLLLSGVGSISFLGIHATGIRPRLIQIERVEFGKYLTIVAQLGLLVFLMQYFEIENQAFYHNLMLLIFFGFLIHSLLPNSYSLPFFLYLSIIAILGIMGLQNALWLIGIGLGLIAICNLPISFRSRALLILAVGLGLALFRGNLFPSPVNNAIWTILGSIFMFRLIIYLYDLKHMKARPDFVQSLSYFFMLPNVVFPFYPLVDFSAFRRNYFDEDRLQVYQTGVEWMFRGFFQLIAYRVVNYYLVISPDSISNFADIVRYVVFNFMLYVRISGQFHLIVGILHLFGFNLPKTNYLYFLSSSFTELWRRINIYWKEFMQKVFYYPIYFKLGSLNSTMRLVVSSLLVFFLSWFFHSYQWFWLRGTTFLVPQDMIFWGILSVFIVANTLYEVKRGRRRSLGNTRWSLKEFMLMSIQIGATFSTMAILWSFWTSDSPSNWFSIWSVAGGLIPGVLQFIGLFLVLGAVLGAVIWFKRVGSSRI
jgi:hypothetical protein